MKCGLCYQSRIHAFSILLDGQTKVVVQGITGREGSFHTEQMQELGTTVVAGTSPGKGGMTNLGVPVFNTKSTSIRFAETCHALGLTHSQITYPSAKLNYADFTSRAFEP